MGRGAEDVITEQQRDLLNSLDGLIDRLDEWDSMAQQAAQEDQDERSWRHVMRTKIYSYLWHAMGWPMEE